MKKNIRIRKEMINAGINQNDLALILGISRADASRLFKWELAKAEQDEMIRKIRASSRGA